MASFVVVVKAAFEVPAEEVEEVASLSPQRSLNYYSEERTPRLSIGDSYIMMM